MYIDKQRPATTIALLDVCKKKRGNTERANASEREICRCIANKTSCIFFFLFLSFFFFLNPSTTPLSCSVCARIHTHTHTSNIALFVVVVVFTCFLFFIHLSNYALASKQKDPSLSPSFHPLVLCSIFLRNEFK